MRLEAEYTTTSKQVPKLGSQIAENKHFNQNLENSAVCDSSLERAGKQQPSHHDF